MNPHHKRIPHLCTAALALLALSTSAALAAPMYQTVALSYDPVPGASSGEMFSVFRAPAIDDAGQIAFEAQLTGGTNSDAIYSGVAGSLTEVAREGGQVPNASSGINFNGFLDPVPNSQGHAAFYASVTGAGVDGTNNIGIYSDASGALAKVARESDQAPGADAGVVFSGMYSPVFNDAGQTAFHGFLTGTGVDNTNNSAIYSEGTGSLTEIAREGDQAPGTALGTKFSSLNGPVLNDSGQTVFSATLTGTGVDSTNDRAIFSEGTGGLTKVAREGDPVPGAAGVTFSVVGGLAFNNAGQTAFEVYLVGTGVDSTNDNAVYSEGSGSLAEVASEGDQAPGATSGVHLNDFGTPIINGAGQSAFWATLDGTGVNSTNDAAIYSEGPGSLTEIAREGDQAPGAPAGVTFSHFDAQPVVNGIGQTALFAFLAGTGVDNSNDRGIYATDSEGVLLEIVREGDLFDVNDDPLIDDLRTVSFVDLVTGSGGEDGRRTSFNDQGQLAFRLGFTDGTQGIFLSNAVAVPEPASAALVGVGGLMLLVRRRRRAEPCGH